MMTTNNNQTIDELIVANQYLASLVAEKEKLATELIIANTELALTIKDLSSHPATRDRERLVKANRMYTFISGINQMILRATDEKSLFHEACRISVEIGKFKMAWIGMIDEETKKVIPVVHVGEEREYLTSIKTISVDDIPEGRGPAGTAIRERRHIFCNNIENDENMAPWKEEAATRGYLSCIALPIKTFGKVVGAYTLYASIKNFFDNEEIAMLEEAAGDISFKLEIFEKEKQKIQAEEKLLQSEARLKEAQAFSHVSNWEIDLLTHEYFWSDEVYKTFDIKKNDIKPSPEAFLSFIHPEDIAYVRESLEKAFVTHNTPSIFFRTKSRDGGTKYLYSECRFEFDENKKPVRLYGIMQDVTERKITENKIQESEEIFRKLFEESADSTLILDESGFINCNQSAVSSLGYSSRKEVLDKHPWDISPIKQPDGRLSTEKAKEMITIAGQQGHSRFEWIHLKSDGTEFPVEVMLTPIILKGRQVYYAIWRDISSRKKKVEKMKQLTNRLILATKSAGMGIWDGDIINGHLKWDDGMFSLYKIDQQQFGSVYEGWISRVHPEDRPKADNEIHMAVDGKKGYDTEFRIIWPDSTVRFIRAKAIIEKDDSGKIIRMVGVNWDITDRKITETNIKESEKRYRQIVETAQEGIWLIDNNSKTTFVNNKLCEIFGYAEEEMLGKEIRFFMDEEGIQLSYELTRQRKEGKSGHFQFKYISKTGKAIWTNVSSNPIFSDDGTYIGSLAMITDITENKKAEEKDRFQAKLLNTIGQAAIATDMEGTITFWNKAAEEIYGWSTEEAIGQNVIDIIPAIQTKEQAQMLFRELVQGHTWSGEFMVKRKDGIAFPVFVTNTPIYDQHNNLSGIIGVSYDITGQKKISEEMKQLTSRLILATKTAGMGIWDWDVSSDHIAWDDDLYSLYQIDKFQSSNIDEEWNNRIHPEDRKRLDDELHMILSGNNGYDTEFRIIWPDSTIRFIRGKAIIEKDASGKVIRIVGVNWDVTDQKNAEKINEEITLDIVQRSKDLEQFSYIVSHNLRSPVANIIGLAGLIKEVGHGENKELLDELSNSATKLDHVIRDLNDILKVKQEISEKKKHVKFSELVRDIEISIGNLIKIEQVMIKSDFSIVDEMFTLKSYLYSIFYNLISNSIKYHQPGIVPEIEIRSLKKQNKTILIFKDNGLGIDLKTRGDQVFGLYKRFHHHIQGKGMGLFMVKKQVESLGGIISVQSQVNKGTTFKIEFEMEKNQTTK